MNSKLVQGWLPSTHPPVGADCLIAEGKGFVSEGAVICSAAAGVVIEVAILPWQGLACALTWEATAVNFGHANLK